ncbi:MAG: hypothetical protein ABWZ42_05140 [Ilumatobacteraceae bacterium]
MTTSIQLLSSGEIMVGDTTFAGGPIAEGGLSVAGHDVWPITLRERNQLLALATDDERGRQVARLIGEAATHRASVDASSGEDADVRNAIEAVALHLAGASATGALARTTLLVARSMGDSAAAVTAWEADRLADALADMLTGPATGAAIGIVPSADDGWTTIRYASPSSALPDDAASDGAHGVAAVRDRLAALLIARDEQPLDAELVDALMRTTEPGQQVTASTDELRHLPTPAPADTFPTSPNDAADRWAGETPVRPLGRTTDDRWHEIATTTNRVSTDTESATKSASALTTTDGALTSVPLTPPSTTVVDDRRARDTGGGDSRASADHGGPAAEYLRAASIRRAPAPPTPAPLAAHVAPGGAAAFDTTAGPAPVHRTFAAPEHSSARLRPRLARSGRSDVAGHTVGATAGLSTDRSSGGTEHAINLDEVALALHRAADLRGLAR